MENERVKKLEMEVNALKGGKPAEAEGLEKLLCEAPDIELVDISQEPWPRVLEFLHSRERLGSAGKSLLNALECRHALSQPQEELLGKVCQRMLA